MNLQGECSNAHFTYIFEQSSDQAISQDVPALDMIDQSMTYNFWIYLSST